MNPVVKLTVAGFALLVFSDALLARRPAPLPQPQPGFIDELAAYDTGRWLKADRWTNGSPFDNAWRADHVLHGGDAMTLRLSNRAYLGEPYSSGEYRTRGFHGYGCYEARFRPIARPGVVTAFFTFAGPYDNGGNGRHNEIDIEFLGKDTSRVQLNFWTNDDTYATDNSITVQLGFDAAGAAHNYGFRWSEKRLEWYVDGQLLTSFDETASVRTPKAHESLQKIMMNAWPVDATAAGWAGTFVYPGAPLEARYEWVRYDRSVDCGFSSGATPAPLR
jgi:beta-glucanase (GH16 family)